MSLSDFTAWLDYLDTVAVPDGWEPGAKHAPHDGTTTDVNLLWPDFAADPAAFRALTAEEKSRLGGLAHRVLGAIAWDPSLHPRDSNGRWVRVGDAVTHGSQATTVTGVGRDGTVTLASGGQVPAATVTKPLRRDRVPGPVEDFLLADQDEPTWEPPSLLDEPGEVDALRSYEAVATITGRVTLPDPAAERRARLEERHAQYRQVTAHRGVPMPADGTYPDRPLAVGDTVRVGRPGHLATAVVVDVRGDKVVLRHDRGRRHGVDRYSYTRHPNRLGMTGGTVITWPYVQSGPDAGRILIPKHILRDRDQAGIKPEDLRPLLTPPHDMTHEERVAWARGLADRVDDLATRAERGDLDDTGRISLAVLAAALREPTVAALLDEDHVAALRSRSTAATSIPNETGTFDEDVFDSHVFGLRGPRPKRTISSRFAASARGDVLPSGITVTEGNAAYTTAEALDDILGNGQDPLYVLRGVRKMRGAPVNKPATPDESAEVWNALERWLGSAAAQDPTDEDTTHLLHVADVLHKAVKRKPTKRTLASLQRQMDDPDAQALLEALQHVLATGAARKKPGNPYAAEASHDTDDGQLTFDMPLAPMQPKWLPKGWQQVDDPDRERRVAEHLWDAAPLADMTPNERAQLIDKWRNDDQRRLTFTYPLTSGAGDVEVSFLGDSVNLTREQQTEVLASASAIAEATGTPLVVHVDASPFPDRGGDGDTLAQTLRGTPCIQVNPVCFEPGFEQHGSMNQEYGMGVPVITYVLAHEVGHVLDNHAESTIANATSFSALLDMSPYGLSAPREAYAEAFAYWLLNGGSGLMPTVAHYASRFKWAEKYPDIPRDPRVWKKVPR